jgi:hypothetical protein
MDAAQGRRVRHQRRLWQRQPGYELWNSPRPPGLTEDKADVNARVVWSGVGINLATNEPTPQALREAIRTVLDKPNYRSRAALMADEFGGIDTRSEVLRIVSQISHASKEGGLWRGNTMTVNRARRVGRR